MKLAVRVEHRHRQAPARAIYYIKNLFCTMHGTIIPKDETLYQVSYFITDHTITRKDETGARVAQSFQNHIIPPQSIATRAGTTPKARATRHQTPTTPHSRARRDTDRFVSSITIGQKSQVFGHNRRPCDTYHGRRREPAARTSRDPMRPITGI